MGSRLEQMSGKKFVNEILAGRTNFRIKLEEGFDLSGYGGFDEMQDCLREQHRDGNRIDISYSEFKHITAEGIYLSGLIGVETNLCGTDLRGVKLNGADLRGADFYRAILYETDLSGVNLKRADINWAKLNGAKLCGAELYEADLYRADLSWADLRDAKLYRADLRGAILYETKFRGADLRGVLNLKHALNLASAEFYEIKVGPKEKRIILDALEKRALLNSLWNKNIHN